MSLRNLLISTALFICAIVVTLAVGVIVGYPTDPDYAKERAEQLAQLKGQVLTENQMNEVLGNSKMLNDNGSIRIKSNSAVFIGTSSIILEWYWYILVISFVLLLLFFGFNKFESIAVVLIGAIALSPISLKISVSLFVVACIQCFILVSHKFTDKKREKGPE